MSKYLFVGDVHATVPELEDCKRLMDYVLKVATENGATIVMLGDQYNNHEVLRVEVLNFWKEVFTALPKNTRVLVGNHDQAGAGSSQHAMVAHSDQVTVVDKKECTSDVSFVPYIHDNEEFLSETKDIHGTLVCHATFKGSKFENGFYAPDGIDPDLLSATNIISGHIHTPQTFGKVTYIGAPRWRNNITDANVADRSIVLYEINPQECTLLKKFSTLGVCSKIHHLVDTAESPVELPADLGIDRYKVDIHGTEEYCQARRPALSRPGVAVRLFKASNKTARVRESEGIDRAFNRFLESYTPTHGISIGVLKNICAERLSV